MDCGEDASIDVALWCVDPIRLVPARTATDYHVNEAIVVYVIWYGSGHLKSGRVTIVRVLKEDCFGPTNDGRSTAPVP